MDKGHGTVTEKISRLRSKQKALEESWSKTGNRSLLQFFIDIAAFALFILLLLEWLIGSAVARKPLLPRGDIVSCCMRDG